MAQGISPNNLNKISQVYLSQISEHHKKDADGNTIPHEGEEVEEGAGLYANIHAKRKRGGKMRKKGDKGAPSSQDFANAARTASEEVVHEKKEMIKVKLKDPSKIKVKVTDIGPGGKEYVRKNEMDEETENEGMQYGIFKGDGKPKGAMAAFGKKKKEKKKVKMEGLSNWKEDYVWEQDEEEMEKEIKEKKVKNKIIINPKLGEAVEELGGELIDVQEMNGEKKEEDPQMKSKMLRQRQLKKQVLLRKLQAVRQTGGEDIVASYEPEGEQVDEALGSAIGIGAALGIAGGAAALVPKIKKFANELKNRSGLNKSNQLLKKNQNNEYEPEGEQLDEYGDPKVGMKLRVARAIDRVNPKPKVGSKRTAMSNALKMSSIKGETKRRKQKENPYSIGKKMKMVVRSMSEGEANADMKNYLDKKAKKLEKQRASQSQAARNNPHFDSTQPSPSGRNKYEGYLPEEGYDIARDMGKVPPTKDKKDATTMPRSYQPQKPMKGKSALDIVKADIRKKMGKGAIMGEAKDKLDENIISKVKQMISKFRNNPDAKIPVGKGKFIPSAAGRMKQIDPEGILK